MNNVTENTRKMIGCRINELLAINDVKQKELAAYLSISDNIVSYFVKGTRVPNTEQIIKISKYFNVSTDYLLGLTDVKTTDTDLKMIVDYTGLSEECIDELHNYCKKLNSLISNDTDFDEFFSILGVAQYEFISTFISEILPSVIEYLIFRAEMLSDEGVTTINKKGMTVINEIGSRYDFFKKACKASKLDIFEAIDEVIFSIDEKIFYPIENKSSKINKHPHERSGGNGKHKED